jgi:hypothetical protein
MGYDRQQPKRRRIDVPISGRPARRKVPSDSSATRQAWIDAAIVIASTLVTTVLLLAISGQIRDTTAAGLIGQSTGPLPETVAARPSPQSSSSVLLHGEPTPAAQPGRAPATPAQSAQDAPATAPAGATDDTAIQAAVDKKLQDEPRLSALGITATVNEGKVMLVGTAPSDEMKAQVEKLVRSIKGVKTIDNQIVVISNG